MIAIFYTEFITTKTETRTKDLSLITVNTDKGHINTQAARSMMESGITMFGMEKECILSRLGKSRLLELGIEGF